MTDRNINDLCPDLQVIAREWLAECAAAGLNVAIIATWRSPEDQDIAESEGLSNAKAGQSPHNCCNPDGSPNAKAFDFGVFEDDDSYVTDGADQRYAKAGNIGISLGLVWGGEWIKFKDFDHLEMANWNIQS